LFRHYACPRLLNLIACSEGDNKAVSVLVNPVCGITGLFAATSCGLTGGVAGKGGVWTLATCRVFVGKDKIGLGT